MSGESPQDVREKAAQDRADEVGEKEKAIFFLCFGDLGSTELRPETAPAFSTDQYASRGCKQQQEQRHALSIYM